MPIITQVPVAITLHSSALVSALPLLDKVQQLRHEPNEGQQPVVWHSGSVWRVFVCPTASEFNNFTQDSP